MEEADGIGCGIFVGALITIVIIILYIAMGEKEPRALDVYRGKTTLEITYKDGVPVDSIVVFK